MLLLIIATWHFDIIKNCLTLTVFKISAKAVSVDTVLSYTKCSKCLPLDFTYSLNLFPLPMNAELCFWRALFCRRFSHIICSATFDSETEFGFRWSFQKGLVHRSPDPISVGGSNLELGGHCFIWIICRKCSHCWATRAVYSEPHASHSVCHFVWQHSAGIFNKLWKQKSTSVALWKNTTTEITLYIIVVSSVLRFVEIINWKLNAKNIRVARFNLK